MLFVVFTCIALAITVVTLRNICLEGKWEHIIFFSVLFFPFYITLLSVVYSTTGSTFLLTIFQTLKEVVMLAAVAAFLLYQRDLMRYPLRLITLDWLFVAFYLLAFVFLVSPIGEATLINKVLYFKNIVLAGLFYFFGRNTRFRGAELTKLFHAILLIGGLAFALNLVELAMDTHFQQFTGYAVFNEQVNEVTPKGNYGLTWTFETQTISKRFASFFADPLELAISSLLIFCVALIMYMTTPRAYSWPYLAMIIVSLATLMFSSSRSSLAALFVLFLYISLVFRLYKVLGVAALLVVGFVIYFFQFASDDFRYFVIDTITFQNTSSVGHLLEWTAALESMISNPLGIGLATSGNVASVEESLRVGGENQFLVFGVQMGWLGMIIYMAILGAAIVYAFSAFKKLEDVNAARIAFVATSVKFAMIFPLFTSNAEKFFFVALLSWWMVGYTVGAVHRQQSEIRDHAED